MQLSRRGFTGLLAGWSLAGCAGASGSGGAGAGGGLAPEFLPVPNAGFDAWVSAFKSRARSKGISDATLDQAFRGAGFLPGVIERDRNQVEFKRSLEDYLAIAASDERIQDGQRNFSRYRDLLARIEARYGVDAHIVTAIWGLESRYGNRRGDIPVISALATLAYEGRRGAFFESQLVEALRILQRGDTSAGNMTGSWAGAMGHTQFIPTSYQAYAVDFTGDGRRDIWSEDPSDSLASTANYLARAGWRRGEPWGVEVRLPAGFNTGLAGRGKNRSATDWRARGVRAANGGRLPDYGSGAIILPQGANGPAFLIFRNFDVIARYNNSTSYVIGVGHLADRIRGGAPIQTPFPPDEYGLTIDNRREIQERLTEQGFDTGGADGVIGPKSRAAIAGYQQSIGMAATGDPSQALLARLRGR